MIITKPYNYNLSCYKYYNTSYNKTNFLFLLTSAIIYNLVQEKRKIMSKIPKFKSEEEEAKFWDTHDLTNYLDEFEEVNEEIIITAKKRT